MNICIISKASPKQLPPMMTVAMLFNDLGHRVHVVTQNVGLEIDLFLNKGIVVDSIINRTLTIPLIGKLANWYKFKMHIKRSIKTMPYDTLYWITGADTLILLSESFIKNNEVVFQLNELNDELPLYQKLSRKKMQLCKKVVVPEMNRSYIAQVMYDLKRKPFVLPNKPYEFARIIQNTPKEVQKYIDIIEEKKKSGKIVFIYQGFISMLRDMTQISKFVNSHNDKCCLVLMGQDEGALKYYKEICPDIIHVPFITAPWHLIVTSHCHIGILVYLPVSLNNIYCAPNKIWEYSKFGLAMVGNDIPGLLFFNELKIGCTIDIKNESDIENKLSNLLNEIENIKQNSLAFYDSMDMQLLLRAIIED